MSEKFPICSHSFDLKPLLEDAMEGFDDGLYFSVCQMSHSCEAYFVAESDWEWCFVNKENID